MTYIMLHTADMDGTCTKACIDFKEMRQVFATSWRFSRKHAQEKHIGSAALSKVVFLHSDARNVKHIYGEPYSSLHTGEELVS